MIVTRDTITPRVRRLRVIPTAPGHFEPTPGPRCECARGDDCLAAHLYAHKHGDIPARCPGEHEAGTGAWLVTCRWYEPPVMPRATEYMGTGRGAGGE